MRKIFCPYCGKTNPAGTTCACRHRVRKATKRDKVRNIEEPWRKNYGTKEFRDNRQLVIERQQGRCIDCGKICAVKVNGVWRTKEYGGEVDHEILLAHGGTNAADFLALRCKHCHSLADIRRRKNTP